MATAPIRPLAREPPYAAGAALKKGKKTNKKKKPKKAKNFTKNKELLYITENWTGTRVREGNPGYKLLELSL